MTKSKGVGISPDNDTSREVAKGIAQAMPSATTICKAWEKAKMEDPSLEFKITFKQWRNKWLKQRSR